MSTQRGPREGLSSQPGADGASRCTWLVLEGDFGRDEPGDEISGYHVCDKRAVVMYSRLNPERRPNEPKILRYPRCKTHDTPAARSRMGLDGYDIEELP